MPVAYAQVLGSGSGDTTPSIMVVVDNTRRGAAAPEYGAQSAISPLLCNRFDTLGLQNLRRITRSVAMLDMLMQFSQAVPTTGMLLTLADMGKKETTLVAPPGLVATFLATRAFLRRGDVTLSLTEVLPEGSAQCTAVGSSDEQPSGMSNLSVCELDGGVQLITACVLPEDCEMLYPPAMGLPTVATPPSRSVIQLPTCPRLACAFGTPAGPVALPSPTPGSGQVAGVRFSDYTPCPIRGGAPQDPSPSTAPVAIHVVTTPLQRGKFHPKRAIALGVPKGRMFGELVAGNAVQLEDGTTITPEQVKDADMPGVAIAVVPCPTQAHFPAVSQHALWQQLQAGAVDTHESQSTTNAEHLTPKLSLVFHLGPAAVTQQAQYMEWCTQAFHDGIQHVFVNESVSSKCPVFRASAGHAARLHLISPSVFPLPWPLNLAEHKAAIGIPALLRRAAATPVPSPGDALPAEPTTDAAQGPHGVLVGGQRKRGRGGQAKGKPAELEPYVPVQSPASVPVDDSPLAWPLSASSSGSDAAAASDSSRLALAGHPLLKVHLLPNARAGVVDVAQLRDIDAFRSDLQNHLMALLMQPSIRPLLPALSIIAATHSVGDSAAAAQGGPTGSPEQGGLSAISAGATTPLGETLGGALSQEEPTEEVNISNANSDVALGTAGAGEHCDPADPVLPVLELGAAESAAVTSSAVPPSDLMGGGVFDSDSDTDVMLMSAACGPTPDGLTTWTFGAAPKAAQGGGVSALSPPPAVVAAASAGLRPPAAAPALPSKATIVFLGTGSALPSKYRNVTGVWMAAPSGAGVLFDAGEGTFGQMVRRFGSAEQPGWARGLPKSAQQAVAELALLWVSHMHADHHLGVPRILQERPAEGPPLLVIAPHEMLLWLQELSALMPEIKGKWVFLPCSHFDAFPDAPHGLVAPLDTDAAAVQAQRQAKAEADALAAGRPLFVQSPSENTAQVTEEGLSALRDSLSLLGASSLHTARVVHCNDAWALRLQSTPAAGAEAHAQAPLRSAVAGEWSVCVSGDCRPCDSVAALSAGASLLIHEATFADGMEQEASEKRHATTHEALTVARSAGVHATLLYHFSQRYPKLPAIAADVSHPVCVAFDFMTVRGSDLVKLPALWPALCAVYDNSMAEDDGGQ